MNDSDADGETGNRDLALPPQWFQKTVQGAISMEDIIGKHIGIYDVLSECDYRGNDGHKLYHVRCCECGAEFDMKKLQIKQTKTCAHLMVGGFPKQKVQWHNPRLRDIFKGMRHRCYSPSNQNYHLYGAKGIKVYEEWLRNPATFEEWAIQNGYDDTLTIDRISSSGDYEPNNCRWVPLEYNSAYKQSTHLLHVGSMAHSGKEWAKICGIGENVINTMLRKHGVQVVIWFIRARIKHPELMRRGNQSWLDVYQDYVNIEQLYDTGSSV